MEPAHWQQIEALFLRAVEVPEAKRAAFLDDACPHPDVRAQVEALLAADATEAGWLDEPHRDTWRALAVEAALNATVRTEKTPEQVGPYRISDLLGRGGMGTVYAADDPRVGRAVAIKVIRRGLDTDDVLRRFAAEQQALARLDHPGIARLYDVGRDADDRPYIVMEYVDGEPLTDYAEAKSLSVDARLQLFRQVCAAVHAAHTQLILHRDLKPGNILVTERAGGTDGVDGTSGPQVKLLDFGLARALAEDGQARTQAVTTLALRRLTPQYASPEQILGQPLSTASDVYGLGVILFELLTGARPHQATSGTMAEWMRLMDTAPMPRRPSEVAYKEAIEAGRSEREAKVRRRALRGELDAIVLKALEPELTDRYASAEQLGADVGRYLRREPILARASTWRYRLRRWKRRAAPYVKYAAAAMIVALLGVIAAMWIGPIDRNPVAFDMDSDYLRILNASGQTIETITRPMHTGRRFEYVDPWKEVSFYDIDGDGQNEMFWLQPSPSGAQSTVRAKRLGDTNLLWERPLTFSLEYPDAPAAGKTHFYARDMVLGDLDGDGDGELFVAAGMDGTFPSLALRLDPETGRVEQRYVHPGWIHQLLAHDLDGDGRQELLAAGRTNAFGGDVMLAVLDPGAIEGHAPQQGKYAVEGFGPAEHLAYVRFPPSQLSRAFLQQRSRSARALRLRPSGLLLVASEAIYKVPSGLNRSLSLHIRLSDDLTVRSVNTSDSYDAMVENMVAAGQLQAPPDKAYWDDWMGRVQYWTGEGWLAAEGERARSGAP